MATPKKIIMNSLEIADKEIRRLREQLMLTENDRDEWKVKAKDLLKENKELKEKLEEADKYVVLQKIKSWEF